MNEPDPEDRRVRRAMEQVNAQDYADRIGTPTGLRDLFPSNKYTRVRTRIIRIPLLKRRSEP